MLRSPLRPVLLAASILLGTTSMGCASAYTGIARVNENTYVLTKTKIYPMGIIRAVVLSCTPSGDALRCTEIE